jgi:MFS family permease
MCCKREETGTQKIRRCYLGKCFNLFGYSVVQRRIALTVYQPARAGVHSFALLAALEAAARGILISVFPVLLYRALGDAKLVSEVYLYIGISSLVAALFTPYLARFIPRRWLYTGGMSLMMAGNLFGAFGEGHYITVALLTNTIALVVMTICFNAYVMDYIERSSMSKNETMRLVYSGAAWAIGPYAGVLLMDISPRAPFLIAIAACIFMIAFFWYLRLGNGKVITKAKKPPANPLAYISRFFQQPSLIAGWSFAVVRSIGWMIYIIYLPIFAVENGLGDKLGGLALSISNALLFLAPLILRFVYRTSVKTAIIVAFAGSAACFFAATAVAAIPMAVVLLLILATLFLVALDVVAGLPFLMSVKPSERTEMAAVYSTFRDISGVMSPAFARVVLIFFPLVGVFAAGGLALITCAWFAGRLHPRLGKKRLSSN